jgi:hypothetical protein
MRFVSLAIGLVMIVSVHAGILFVETDAPRISASWYQGVERATIYFTNGETYRTMMVLRGPNQCFTIGADGNDRAILIEPESDDRGPYQPDAIVDCRICGCEDEPGTRFTCASDGRCEACDPCSSTVCDDGELCVRHNCDAAVCTCDPIICSGSTCDERILNENRCEDARCVQERSCVENRCGAECTSGTDTRRTWCEDDILMQEKTTCTSTCLIRTVTRRIEDCSQRDCRIGTLPRCTSEGCSCI